MKPNRSKRDRMYRQQLAGQVKFSEKVYGVYLCRNMTWTGDGKRWKRLTSDNGLFFESSSSALWITVSAARWAIADLVRSDIALKVRVGEKLDPEDSMEAQPHQWPHVRIGDRVWWLRVTKHRSGQPDGYGYWSYDEDGSGELWIEAPDKGRAAINAIKAIEEMWGNWKGRALAAAYADGASGREALTEVERAEVKADFDAAAANLIDGTPLPRQTPPARDAA